MKPPISATILLSHPGVLRIVLAALSDIEVTTAGRCFGLAFTRISGVVEPLSAVDRAAVALCQARQIACVSPC